MNAFFFFTLFMIVMMFLHISTFSRLSNNKPLNQFQKNVANSRLNWYEKLGPTKFQAISLAIMIFFTICAIYREAYIAMLVFPACWFFARRSRNLMLQRGLKIHVGVLAKAAPEGSLQAN